MIGRDFRRGREFELKLGLGNLGGHRERQLDRRFDGAGRLGLRGRRGVIERERRHRRRRGIDRFDRLNGLGCRGHFRNGHNGRGERGFFEDQRFDFRLNLQRRSRRNLEHRFGGDHLGRRGFRGDLGRCRCGVRLRRFHDGAETRTFERLHLAAEHRIAEQLHGRGGRRGGLRLECGFFRGRGERTIEIERRFRRRLGLREHLEVVEVDRLEFQLFGQLRRQFGQFVDVALGDRRLGFGRQRGSRRFENGAGGGGGAATSIGGAASTAREQPARDRGRRCPRLPRAWPRALRPWVPPRRLVPLRAAAVRCRAPIPAMAR